MRIKDSFTSVRVQVPGRRVALISLVLASIALGVSLYFGPPPTVPRIDLPFPALTLPLVGGALPLLALLASAFCLFGAASPVPPPAQGPGEPSPVLLAGLQAIVQELNAVLTGERSQVLDMHRSCNTATQEAIAFSARVARMADTVIDAEARLAAGVAQAEKALKQPAAVVTWAAEATQRVERALPEIAELIKAGLGNLADPPFDAAARRLQDTVDSAVQAFRGAISDATGQITALGEISIALRRDAVALDKAGREIATVGATVVARAGEAVGQVDAALATLPEAIASVTAAAGQIGLNIEDASAALRTAGEEAREAAGTVRSAGQDMATERQAIDTVASGIRAAVGQIAAVVASVDAVRADTAGMAELSERLKEAASVLQQGTDSLDRAGQRVAGRLDYACEEIWSAGDRMVAQVAGALAPLPAAAASVATAADEAANALTERMREAASLLATATSSLDAASRRAAERLDTAGDRMAVQVGGALAPLPLAVDRAAEALTERLRGAAGSLADGSAVLEATGQRVAERLATAGDSTVARIASAIAPLPETVGRAAQTLAATARETATGFETAGQRVAERLMTAGDAAAGRIADAVAPLPDAAGQAVLALAAAAGDVSRRLNGAGEKLAADLAGTLAKAAASVTAATEQAARTLTEASAVLCADSAALEASGEETMQAAAALRREAETWRDTGQAVAAAERQAIAASAGSLEATASRLAAIASGAESARQDALALSEVAATLEHVTATLADGAGSMDAASQRIAAAGESVAERLAEDAHRGEAVMRALPDIALDIAAAARRMADTDSAAGTAINAVAERAAGEIAGQIERLAGVTGQAEARIALLPDAAGQIAAAAAHLRSVIDAMPAAPDTGPLDALGARLEAAVPRLEAGLARIPNEAAHEAAAAALAALSGDVGESVRRVEAALADHDTALADLVASMTKVQAAEAEVEAAAPGDAGAALAATLRHFDGVASQTEMLLRQTEALAEAVMDGRAPGLSPVLADRAPALLAGVETATRRLRSVATALALASDGPRNAQRRPV